MASRKAVATLAKPELYPLYLYKRILRLHYGLPPPARLMGDTYVKDEFRRHKDANAEHTAIFLNEWTDLDPEKLDSFAEEQLRQLLDLKLESERMKADLVKQSEDSNSSESIEEKRPHAE
ncbi:unnamed protein product [Haemonchus placei]|uniref:Succinate dehydrogenase assembly factor 3 n=1 Tax=Haemonchus placei TaxID=6290 RepID=A0A0N4WQ65_HAEPC|nr:unnamed protein product [Haemonchus placei]